MSDLTNQVIPLEAEGVQPGFDIVLRGYDRGQVDRQITWLEEQLGATDRETAALTEALRRAEHESVEARKQAEKVSAELTRGKPTFEALGERIGTILRLAEEEAEELRRTGGAELEQARNAWTAEHGAARRTLDEEQRNGQQQAASILAQAQQEAQRIVTDARRAAAETTGAAQRQVEAMSRQRDAIHAELLRVRERFAAVMGGTIDVTDASPEAPERSRGQADEQPAERTTIATAAADGAVRSGGADAAPTGDTDTARTQPMPAEPTAS